MEPTTTYAGDTLSWRRDDLVSRYPALAGWQLKYKLTSAATAIAVDAVADGAAFIIDIPAAVTATWPAADYAWVAYVTNGAQRYTIGQGRLTVKANVAAASAGIDLRSSARKALDAVNASLATYGAKAYLQEIEIADRRQRFTSASDFMAFRSRLIQEVAREDVQSGARAKTNPRMLVRFR